MKCDFLRIMPVIYFFVLTTGYAGQGPSSQDLGRTCFAIADGGPVGLAQDSRAEDYLVYLDKSTVPASVTKIGDLDKGNASFDVEALAFWPNRKEKLGCSMDATIPDREILFGSNGSRLVYFDWKSSGLAVPVGAAFGKINGALGEVDVKDVDGIFVDATRQGADGFPIFWGSVRLDYGTMGKLNDLLFQIDPCTGLAKKGGFPGGVDYVVVQTVNSINDYNHPIALQDVDDIAVDPKSGTFYAVINNTGEQDELATLDPFTGEVLTHVVLGIDDAEGLSFDLEGKLFVSTGKDTIPAQKNSVFDLNPDGSVNLATQKVLPFEDYEGLTCFTRSFAQIGDRVWRDEDGNGVQDPGESGLSGVSVKLFTAGGLLQSSTFTDVNGLYQFIVPQGSYYLEFGTLAGYQRSPQDNVGNDEIDSDANFVTGKTGAITVFPDDEKLVYDAGLIPVQPQIEVLKKVYIGEDGGAKCEATLIGDASANEKVKGVVGTKVTYCFRVKNTGPVDLFNVTLKDLDLFGTVGVAQQIEPGAYADYWFESTIVKDLLNTATARGVSAADIVVEDTDTAQVCALAIVGDFVWNDLNYNGIQDGEPPLAGVTLQLYREDNTLVAQTVSDANGNYRFEVEPGNYYLFVASKNGFSRSFENVGANNALDSDPGRGNGRTEVFTLDSGEIDLTWDSGHLAYSTAVELSSFTAALSGSTAKIDWTTGSETDNFGFNLFRSSTVNGDRTQVNEALVEAKGAAAGSDYTFLTELNGLSSGRYYFWLQDLEYGGKTEFHGPVAVDYLAPQVSPSTSNVKPLTSAEKKLAVWNSYTAAKKKWIMSLRAKRDAQLKKQAAAKKKSKKK